MKILFRPSLPSDHPFIFATYIRNRFFDSSNQTTLKRATWSALQHKRIEGILEAGQPPVVIACLDEDPDIILGYGFQDGAEGPFVYVKLAYRSPGFGIKEKLLQRIKE